MRVLPFRQLYIPLKVSTYYSQAIHKIKNLYFDLNVSISYNIRKNFITEIAEKMNLIQRWCQQYTDMLQIRSQRDYTCLKFWIVWTWFLAHELIQWIQQLCNMILGFITQSDFWRFEFRKLDTIAKCGV